MPHPAADRLPHPGPFGDEMAEAYADMHNRRLEGFGVTGIRARNFDVNETLTAVTRVPVT